MSETTSTDLIRYDILVQDALRGAVRKVLSEVAKTGLPGEHHFFILFDTNAPGVRISSRLHDQYPDEMTVVLQHQYWDLEVTDHGFEVGLSFNGVPERLLVPFTAIKGFFDPSVQFSLRIDHELVEDISADEVENENAAAQLQQIDSRVGDDDTANSPESEATEPAAEAASDETPAEKPDDAEDSGADVVSLDAFRKKT